MAKSERCRVCKRKVKVMCQKGTGICSGKCQKKEKDE